MTFRKTEPIATPAKSTLFNVCGVCRTNCSAILFLFFEYILMFQNAFNKSFDCSINVGILFRRCIKPRSESIGFRERSEKITIDSIATGELPIEKWSQVPYCHREPQEVVFGWAVPPKQILSII
ncbi:unnamed protein product [Albugo candida]|uniref:Uncharacterized protein n=1 Tax=Albugo candida TaxID=65357 RepID=A0A024GJP3_9STRA|nr:unnamed protein product [Albugo candida]|eukprot:CCI47115.1 unnamed protein product [Albugo candida]